VLWLPLAPGTDGNGNQPRKLGSFWSGVRVCMVPGSQAPMSSIPALPLASRPAELPAPCCPGVARKSGWNGLGLTKVFVSSPAFTKHASVKSCFLAALDSAVAEHSCTAKLYQKCAAGHLSPAPTATGAETPLCLSLAMAAFSSSIVVGVEVMPAL